ncbi:hypothetical protein BGW39_007361 [Mortierella sp. 14UC]|nr:hypothetical protein BGW39_007361 [Mortierella sp. 14UC]
MYQHYYLTETFKGSASTFQLAWIGTLSWAANQLVGPFTGAICAYFAISSIRDTAWRRCRNGGSYGRTHQRRLSISRIIMGQVSLCLHSHCGIERLATVTGIIFAGMAIGAAVGSPVSGAILDTVGYQSDYTMVVFWSGTVILAGGLIQFGIKFLVGRRILAKM